MSTDSSPPTAFSEVTVEDLEAAEDVEVKDLSNMLLIEIDGRATYMSNTPKNKLLFDRETYAVNGKSLYTLLHGAEEESRIVLCDDDPYVAIAPSPHENVYRLWYGSRNQYSVRTPVGRVEDVLRGIISLVEDDDPEQLADVYTHVIDNQVRREIVGLFLDFGKLPTDRIEVLAEGWLIDEMFLVTWDAEVYLFTDNWRAGSYDPRSSEQYEHPGEFLTITPTDDAGEPIDPEPHDVSVGEQTVRFGKLEWVFIYRVQWLLDWEHNIDDPAKVEVIKRTFDEYGEML